MSRRWGELLAKDASPIPGRALLFPYKLGKNRRYWLRWVAMDRTGHSGTSLAGLVLFRHLYRGLTDEREHRYDYASACAVATR